MNDKKNSYQDDATTNAHRNTDYDSEKNEEDADDPSDILMIGIGKRAWQNRIRVHNEQIKQQQQQKNKERITTTIIEFEDDDDYCTIKSSHNRELYDDGHNKLKQMQSRLYLQQQQEQQYLEKETFVPTTLVGTTTAGACRASHPLY